MANNPFSVYNVVSTYKDTMKFKPYIGKSLERLTRGNWSGWRFTDIMTYVLLFNARAYYTFSSAIPLMCPKHAEMLGRVLESYCGQLTRLAADMTSPPDKDIYEFGTQYRISHPPYAQIGLTTRVVWFPRWYQEGKRNPTKYIERMEWNKITNMKLGSIHKPPGKFPWVSVEMTQDLIRWLKTNLTIRSIYTNGAIIKRSKIHYLSLDKRQCIQSLVMMSVAILDKLMRNVYDGMYTSEDLDEYNFGS
jgi:hypothetical protein